jgi:hypothetical protein
MAKINCPDRGNKDFLDLSNALGSDALAKFIWYKNGNLPLNQTEDAEGNIVPSEVYDRILNEVAEGNEAQALAMVSTMYLPSFQEKYREEDPAFTVDYIKQEVQDRQDRAAKRQGQLIEEKIIPGTKTLYIQTPEGDIVYTQEEGKEIFDSLEYLLATKKSWKSTIDALKERFEDIRTKVKNSTVDPNVIVTPQDTLVGKNLVNILKNWPQVKAWYLSQESVFGLEAIDDEVNQEVGNKIYNKNAHDSSQMDLASSQVIKLVQALPKYNKLTTQDRKDIKSGKKSISDFQVISNITGFPVVGNFSTNWNVLTSSLSGITEYPKILAELAVVAQEYPQFNDMVSLLPEEDVQDVDLNTANFVASFVQTVSMPEILAYQLSVKKLTGSTESSNLVSKVFQLGTRTTDNLVRYFDEDYFKSNPKYGTVNDKGETVLNVPKLLEDFSYIKNIKQFFAGRNKLTNEKGDYTPEGKELLQGIHKFYNALGIIPTNALYQKDKKALYDFLSDTTFTVRELYDKLEESIDNTSITQPLQFLGKSQGSGKALGPKFDAINAVVGYYGKFEREFASGSYFNSEDKLQYNRVQYFYLTQVTNALNSVKSYNELIAKPEFAHLDVRLNPNIIGSLWLEKMFGITVKDKTLPQLYKELNSGKEFPRLKTQFSKQDFKINIVNFSGVKVEADLKDGVTTTELTSEDKIIQDFASFFQEGMTENIRFGDKGTSYATMTSGKVEERMYVPLDPAVLGSNEKSTVVEKVLADQFKAYLTSEVARVLNILNSNKKHVYNTKGKELFIFKDILPKEDYADLTSNDKATVIAAFTRVSDQLPTHLSKYFETQTALYKQRLIESTLGDKSAITDNSTEQQKDQDLANMLNALNFANPALFKKNKITPQNLDYVIANYLKNDFIHKVEFMKVFVGDIANFQVKGDFREVFKRIPFTSSPGFVFQDNAAVMAHLNNSGNTNGLYKALRGATQKFRKTVRTVVFNDVNTFSKEDWPTYRAALGLPDTLEYQEYVNSPKEADAQGLVSLDFYRNYLIGLGQWSQEQENAYLNEIEIFKILNKKDKTEEDYAKMQELKDSTNYVGFPPLKLGHYGAIVEDPKLTALHKYSLAPMIPSMIAGTQLEELNKQMIAKQIDYATFNSGSKASNYGDALDFYVPDADNAGTLKVNPSIKGNNITSLHLKNLKQQQYIAPKLKNEATLSTQMVKLIFGDFFTAGNLSNLNASTAKTVQNLYKEYDQVLGNIIGIEQANLFNKIGLTRDSNGAILGFDNKKFYNFLKSEMDKRDTSQSLRRYIQLDAAGNIKYPLDATKNRAEIENILLSIINNKIISQKIHGESYIQMASTAQGNTRFTKPTEEQIKKFGINGLRFYRKGVNGTEPADVKIAFNPKKHAPLLNLTFKGQKIGTVERLNKILKSNNREAVEWVDQNTKQLSLVGVRIPVQGLNSMEYFRVREFLPTSAGPVIVVPAQIVVKSGSDFDIDKLTMFEPRLDQNGQLISDAGFTLSNYNSALPSKAESVRLLKTLRAAKQSLVETLETIPSYLNKKELEKEIKELNESMSSTEENIGKFANTKMNLEEFQALMSEGSTEKEDLIKQKIEEVKALSKSGELTSALSALKALKNEIGDYSSAVSNVNNFKDGNVNRLIDVFTSVISLSENYNKLVLPNTNTILTEISDKLDQNPITSTGLFSPLTSNRVYGDNIESKKALGIDAKLNTMQKEFQIAGLVYNNELSEFYPFDANRVNGGISLGEQTLTDGTVISRVISETINGHVDIAKEDWIILLGLDKAKTPLFHAMILAGTPVRTALDFLNKPLVKYVLKESNRGLLFKQIGMRRGRPVSMTFKNVMVQTLKDLNVSDNTKSYINIAIDTFSNKDVVKFKPLMMDLNRFITEGGVNNESDKQQLEDLFNLYIIKELQGSVQQLTSLVDYNTKRFQNSYQVKADAITYGRVVESFNRDGLNKLTQDSALSNFNQAGTVLSIMPQVFDVSNHPSVLDAISQYTNRAGKYTDDDLVKASKKIKDNYLVAMVQLFGVDQTGTKLQDKFFSASGLFNKTYSNNIAKKLADLTEKYSDLSKNQIIANLYTAENSSKNIIFKLRNANLDAYLVGEYEKAFIEGLNDVREDVSELFKNIGLGTFLQFGFSNNSYGLSQVIPYETYVDQTTKAVNKLKLMQGNKIVSEQLAGYISQMTYFNDSKDVPTLVLDKNVAKIEHEPDFNVRLLLIEEKIDSALRAILTFQTKNYTNLENLKSTNRFRGLRIEFVDKLSTSKNTPVAMRNSNGVIQIAEKDLLNKFNEKAWTKSAKQKDDSYSTPLASDEFKSFEEFLTFALIHEVKHETIKKSEDQTIGQYEDQINEAALVDLRNNYKQEKFDDVVDPFKC